MAETTPSPSSIDQLIKLYADHLRHIYDTRTAGDHTFTGVLSGFLSDVNLRTNRKEGN